ncbi:helix-turn-helix domain-containing protein [Streptomyces sp. NPDC087300]|uniref:helix-turn-helix domain-containing protein n=1 Tax=Streptomyces sp. NPDC087300 TaxID=3365780 RepID=UPI00382E3534
MLPTGAPPDWTSVEIATPRPSLRLPGISMAGFRACAPSPVDIAMVAHPCLTLLFDLGGSAGEGLVHEAREWHGRGSIAVGLLPGELRLGGRVGECLQIRVDPVVAAAAFGAAAELGGTVASFEDVWGRGAGRAEGRLRAAGSWDERFTIAVDLLGRRLDARPGADPEVAEAWRRTRGRRGLVRVDGLADELGWSRKRLSARFRSQLGIAPKRAARLVRFDHAVHLLAAGRDVARVAAESGYVDQPHLHREVKAFTGLTPTAAALAPWLAIDDIAWPPPPRDSVAGV